MKLYNVKDIKALFDTVQNCEGRVEMVLPSQNISLNDNTVLSEALCQAMPEAGLREIELVAEKPADVYKLLHFAMRGETTRSILAKNRKTA